MAVRAGAARGAAGRGVAAVSFGVVSLAAALAATSVAFGSGAGAEIRQVMGVTVFAGMLGVTLFGLLLTPIFYVVVRRLAIRRSASPQQATEAHA